MTKRVVFVTLLVACLTMVVGCSKPMLFEGKVLDMNWATTHDGPMLCKGEVYLGGSGGADVVLKRTHLVNAGASVTYTQMNPDGTFSIFGPIKLADGDKIAKGEKCFECAIPAGLALAGGTLGVVIPIILNGKEEHLVIPMGGEMLVSGLVQFATEDGPFAFTLAGAKYGVVPTPKPPTVVLTKPSGPVDMTSGETLDVSADIGGDHPVHLTVVTPEGVVWEGDVTPPATFVHSFVLHLVGDGRITVRVVDLVTGLTAEASQPVTVKPVTPSLGAVPDLTGLTEIAARDAVSHTCLVVGVVTYQYHPTIPTGTVIDWNPKGEVVCDTAINLVISKGPEPPATAVVPNVVGLPKAVAMTTITATGLVVGTITESYSATVTAGLVVSSTPSAGAIVDLESAVGLVVSKGPEPMAVFGLTVTSPSDGATVVNKATVMAQVTGPNPVNVVVVSPDGQVYRVNGAIPTYNLSHEFVLEIEGTGLFTVRVTDTVTLEVLERTRAVTVTLTK